MAKFIKSENLSNDFQVRADEDGKKKVVLSESINARLLPEIVEYYTLSINSTNAEHRGTTGNEARRRFFAQGKFGYVHLDFTYKGTNNAERNLFTLPSGCPRPNGLIEVQTFDGGSIWITDNGNIVKGSGLTTGQRYIVDIIGFWRK